MRHIALSLAAAGVVALGLTGSPAPAQAQNGYWGYPGWHHSAWRDHEARERWWRHHEWRMHHHWHPWYRGY